LAAVWATTAMKAFALAISVHDALTFTAAPVVLVLVALGTTAVPAWRAADTDALIAMRSE
jgi:hypothetical protein